MYVTIVNQGEFNIPLSRGGDLEKPNSPTTVDLYFTTSSREYMWFIFSLSLWHWCISGLLVTGQQDGVVESSGRLWSWDQYEKDQPGAVKTVGLGRRDSWSCREDDVRPAPKGDGVADVRGTKEAGYAKKVCTFHANFLSIYLSTFIMTHFLSCLCSVSGSCNNTPRWISANANSRKRWMKHTNNISFNSNLS